MLEIKEAGQMELSKELFVIIYGDTGVGKSTAAAVLEDALIIVTETNGLKSIARVNPKAKTLLVKNFEEIREAFKIVKDEVAMAKKENRKPKFKWVVLDSFTDAQQMLKRDILDSGGEKNRVTLSQPEWGVIADRSFELCKAFRDLEGVNRLIISQLATMNVTAPDGSEYHVKAPALMGRSFTENKFVGMADICGLMYKGVIKDAEGKTTYTGTLVQLVGSDRNLICKGVPNLGKVELPRYDEWLARVQAETPIETFSSVYGGLGDIPKVKEPEKEEPKKEETKKKGEK